MARVVLRSDTDGDMKVSTIIALESILALYRVIDKLVFPYAKIDLKEGHRLSLRLKIQVRLIGFAHQPISHTITDLTFSLWC